MSAGQPPRPGFPGAMPARAVTRPGVAPQHPGPGRPPMMAGPRPVGHAVPPQAAMTPGRAPMSPAQQVLQQARPGLVARTPMQPRVPSPVRGTFPAGEILSAAPAAQLMTRPGSPGQGMPQRVSSGPESASANPRASMPPRPIAGTAPQIVRPVPGAQPPLMRSAAGTPVTLARPGAAATPVRPIAGASPSIASPPSVQPAAGVPAPSVRPVAGATVPLVGPAARAPLVRPAAGAPLVRPAAGAPLVRPVAGAPLVRPAVGAPLVRPAVGAPLVRPPVGAPLVRPAAGAPLVRPAAGAAFVGPAAGTPLVRPAAGAPLVRPAAGAPLVRPAAGAPLVRPAAGAPLVRPAAGAPNVRPVAGAPLVRPAAGAPLVRPAAGAPLLRPAAGTPVVRPAAGSPVVRPAAGAPLVRPVAGTPATVVRPAAGVMAPGERPAAGVGPPVVRPVTGGPVPVVRPPASAVPPSPVPQVRAPGVTAPQAVPVPVQAPAPSAAAAPAQSLPTAGGDRASTCDLNMDDIRETFRQVFQGQPPEPSQRAEPGTEGTPCKVLVNMYPVTLPRGHVYHYDIEIFSALRKGPDGTTPVPTQKRARCASTLVNREVIDAFSKCYKSELGNCFLAFDGRKNLYTRRMLPFTDHIFSNVEAEVNGEKCAFVVRIAYAATVSFDALHAMYESPVKGTSQFQDAVQVADVILRTGPTLAFVPVGRSFFLDSGKPISLTGNREVWFGFYSSIRLGSWKPLVNIDMSATAFYSEGPLLDFAVSVLKKKSRNDLKAGMSDRERVMLAREIRTLKVVVTHLDSRRQYRIEGVRTRPANQETFDLQGTETTVTQYFAQKYNKTLEFPNLPCIYTGKGNTFLPIEVCSLVKGQHCRKKLNEQQTATMIRQTALVPRDRFERIKQSTAHLKRTSAQICKEFDMTLDTNPIEIEARILRPPQITYGDKKKQMPKDGVWRCDTFLKPANIEKWVLAVLGRVSKEKPKHIVDLFQQEGGKLGMKIAPPKLIHTYGHQAKPRQVLEDVKGKHPDVEMTVIVLDPRSDYGALKAEAETSDLCMRTQCVKDVNIETKFNPMFAGNLLQKINTKMGGRNNGVFLPNLPKTLKRPYMAIGVDVNHPGPGDTTPSIAAFVASMDAVPAQYYACTSVQLNRRGSRSEYVVETKSMFLECLTEFQKRNKDLPAHIFIFRDGVADAQFDAVRIYELGAIRKACLEIRPDYTPGMTFIVVQKRHHVRFMPGSGYQGQGRTGNIHAGTIVDSKIINPAIFDFYLCSHQGIQGTSRAAHYHVVHDDVHHTQDEIYKICYNLCHTYSRCPRAVSIPAPAYYAHLAAFRAKEHIKGRGQHGGTYAESNSGSVRSSSSSEPDLDKFQSAQKVLNQMRGSMYFV